MVEAKPVWTEGQRLMISAAKYLYERWTKTFDIDDKLASDLCRWLVGRNATIQDN